MEPSSTKTPLYPQVPDSNPDLNSPFLSSSSSASIYPSLHHPSPPTASAPPATTSSLYPSLNMNDLAENLFADHDPDSDASAQPLLPPPVEETILRVPGAMLHLIDAHASVELGSGDFSVVRLRQGDNVVAVFARIGEDLVQWPLARDEAAVKLDDSHYFFSLHVPPTADDPSGDLLNYGLTFASKGQDKLLIELDRILESYSSFSVQKVEVKEKSEVVDGSVAKEVTPAEVMGSKKEMMEQRSAAYWTTLAPNVEDYSSSAAKAIAKGSGKLVKGILWCGDVTVDRLKWGEEVMRRRMSPSSKPTEISADAMKQMKRYGDQAAEITHEGLDAAGHAFGTAWAVFKIRNALNPKSVIKPTTLAKSAAKAAAEDLKANKRK